MKKLMIMAVALLATLSVSAQGTQQGAGKMYVKPMVGATLSSFTNVEMAKAKYKLGLVAGGEFGCGIVDRLDLTAGVLVAMQGTGYKDTEYTKDYNCTTTMLNVPVLANFYILPGLALKAGIQPGFLLGQKTKGKTKVGSTKEFESFEDTSTEDMKKVDLSIPFGISYEIADVVVDARFNLGLTKISDYVNTKNSVFMLTIGYKIPL